jgi:hypothetical protein
MKTQETKIDFFLVHAVRTAIYREQNKLRGL